MFIRHQEFKKIVQGAYKTCGIIVGKIEDEYHIIGGYWKVIIKEDRLDKKLKSILIEACARLPFEDEFFRAKQGVEEEEDVSEELLEISELIGSCKEIDEAIKTCLMIYNSNGLYRVIQGNTGQSVIVNEVLVKMIDSTLQTGDEVEIIGPEIMGTDKIVKYWNDECTVLVVTANYGRKQYEVDLFEALKSIDLDPTIGVRDEPEKN